MSCPYKNIFGAPGTGAHSYRFMGFAIADTVLTLMLAVYTAWEFGGNVFLHFLFWIVIAEVLSWSPISAFVAGVKMLSGSWEPSNNPAGSGFPQTA